MADVSQHELGLPEGEDFSSLVGVRRDLINARRYFSLVPRHHAPLSESDKVRAEACLIAGLITYDRAFATMRRKWDADVTLDRLHPSWRELHEAMREVRSKHYAHSVNDMERNVPTVFVSTDGETRTVLAVGCLEIRSTWLQSEVVEGAVRLCTLILEDLRPRTESAKRELLPRAQALGPDHFVAKGTIDPTLARDPVQRDRSG